MRIIESVDETREIAALLPAGLQAVSPGWNEVKNTGFRLCCDLLYFDVVLPANLKWMPKILRGLGEEKCFIFNHSSLLHGGTKDGSDIAIEITANCDSAEVERELSNEGKNHHRYLSVFYFVGDFGIISPEKGWFMFARTDDHALFTSESEQIYSDFNEYWWSYVAENRRRVA